jgi:prophage maintenance system killer protein
MARKAAALVESMSTNHGFADGNKRTTVILLHLLVSKSGYGIMPISDRGSPSEEVEEMVLGVVNHDLNYDGLVEWFRQRLYKLDR